MALTSGFFISKNRDRTYGNDVFSEIFDGIINDGVFASVGTFLSTTPHSGMSVTIGVGRAWFNQTWTFNSSPYIITFSSSDNIMPRIDTIVLEVNKTDGVRDNLFKVITGTPSINPVPPTLNPPEKVFWHPISNVTIRKQTEEITVNDIDILVGKDVCPFVTGLLETVSIETLFEKWTDDFENWLEHLKNELDENQAANLQNQIDHILNGYGVTTGSGYELKVNINNFSLLDGTTVRIKLHSDILENATLEVNNTGAKKIVYADDTPMIAYDYIKDNYIECTYNGNEWQIRSPKGNNIQAKKNTFYPDDVFDNIFIENQKFLFSFTNSFFGKDAAWYQLYYTDLATNTIEIIRARDKATIFIKPIDIISATPAMYLVDSRNGIEYCVLCAVHYNSTTKMHRGQKILIPTSAIEEANNNDIISDAIIEYTNWFDPTPVGGNSWYPKNTMNQHRQLCIGGSVYHMFFDVNTMTDLNETNVPNFNINWGACGIGKDPNTMVRCVFTVDTTTDKITGGSLSTFNLLTSERTSHELNVNPTNTPYSTSVSFVNWVWVGYSKGWYVLVNENEDDVVLIRESDWTVFHTWNTTAINIATPDYVYKIYDDNTFLVCNTTIEVSSISIINIITGEIQSIPLYTYNTVRGPYMFNNQDVSWNLLYFTYSNNDYAFDINTKTLYQDKPIIKLGTQINTRGLFMPKAVSEPETISDLDDFFRVFRKATLVSYKKKEE